MSTSQPIHSNSLRLLVIDNYDSFTYNLVQALESLGAQCDVHLNDQISLEAVLAHPAEALLISPGPGKPRGAGLSLAALDALAGKKPILGVCLGHQAIAEHWGAELRVADRFMHGKTSEVSHTGEGLFAGLPSPLVVGRYHSWLVQPDSLPDCLEPVAFSEHGELMGLRHREWPIWGVQFHPESILTPLGSQLLGNWLNLVQAEAK